MQLLARRWSSRVSSSAAEVDSPPPAADGGPAAAASCPGTPLPVAPSASTMVTVLLMGETGSGKSTLINGLVNTFANSRMQDADSIKVAIATQFLPQSPEFAALGAGSEAGGSSTHAQTQGCSMYSLTASADAACSLQGIALNIVDTPGLSDTRGMEKDDANLKDIIDTVMALPDPGLTALVLVVNGSAPRHTINVRNMLTRLRGNMPDVVLHNLFVVCTNCMAHSCNVNERGLAEVLSLPRGGKTQFFYVQNSAFSSHPSTWSEKGKLSVAREWSACKEDLTEFVNAVCNAQRSSGAPRNLCDQFKTVQDGRFNLMQILHSAQLEAGKLGSLLDALDVAEAHLKQHAQDATKFANYTQTTTVSVSELVDAPYHSTICRSCNVVCHDHCGLTEIRSDGDNAFLQCAAFSGRSACQGGGGKCHCSHTTHYHGKKTMVTKNKSISNVLADIKAKYDSAVQGRSSAQTKLDSSQAARAQVLASMADIGPKLLKECKGITAVCSGFNLVDELFIQVEVMKTAARHATDHRVRKQMEGVIMTVEAVIQSAQQAAPTLPDGAERGSVIGDSE